MRLHLRTCTLEEVGRTFPQRVLLHLQFDHLPLVVTGEFGERFGYFEWRRGFLYRKAGPEEKEGELHLDDPSRAGTPCGEGCEGDHFLKAPCNFLEMASVAAKLLAP